VLAAILANEEVKEQATISPYVFGAVGLGAMLALLVVTWLIKVER
jgi:hypothetical protein